MSKVVCLHCKREFVPYSDCRSHEFCSFKCIRAHKRECKEKDIAFRAEIGLPRRGFALNKFYK